MLIDADKSHQKAKKIWEEKLESTTESYKADLKDYEDSIAENKALYEEVNDKYNSQRSDRIAAEKEL